MEQIPYKLTFEERDAYLYACVEAESVSFEMVIEYTNRIVQHLKNTRHHRLLLVNDSPVLPSTDCYLIASYIVKNALPSNIRIAVVDATPGNRGRQAQITRDSRAAGLDIQAFSVVEEATEWLLTGSNGRSMGAH